MMLLWIQYTARHWMNPAMTKKHHCLLPPHTAKHAFNPTIFTTLEMYLREFLSVTKYGYRLNALQSSGGIVTSLL